jgi:hypothetical protein
MSIIAIESHDCNGKSLDALESTGCSEKLVADMER